jgi:hypothetical protein
MHRLQSNLDRENLSNYRPVSHLYFLSKLTVCATERIVRIRLMHHLSSHNLLNPFQSAYIKFHSSETALLSFHDHIIKAMGQQQITCLCLLDFSAAFDTIDHCILLERLSSWFGLDRNILSWIASYLTGRSFHISLNNFTSSSFHSKLAFLKGLFLLHFYLFCIPHLLVTSFLVVTLITISMLLILNSTSPSPLPASPIKSHNLKPLYLLSKTG